MSEFCIIGVPESDREDLVELADHLRLDNNFGQHRYFDGSTFVEILLPMLLSTGSWLTLRTWIKARAETQKQMRVTCGGIEITGMAARDAERVIKTLAEAVELKDDADI